ncbi:MAG: M24 family metallopeptidase, partial [Spirochaetota bacterium]
MPSIESIREAIRSETLAGWLFYNFKHRDPLSDRILGVPSDSVNTRPWYLLVPARGEPVKIVHAIESSLLAHLPGRTRSYVSREELRIILTETAGEVNGPVCAGYSELLPALSFLDHGTALLLGDCGFELTGSAGCLQRVLGSLSPEGRSSHRRAAGHLYQIGSMAWKRIAKDFSEGNPVTEGSIRDYMLAELEKRDLTTDHPPIVAAGPNSADPHYAAAGPGAAIERNEVVLFDIWAKEEGPESVYADISWMGYTSPAPPLQVVDRFQTLTH